MNVIFSPNAWKEYQEWQQTNPKMLKRINALIKEVMREPFGGIGKPEPLRNELSGYWSRRIDQEHRLVYKVEKGDLTITQVMHHY